MGKNHKKLRRENFHDRVHDIATNPRPFPPSDGAPIGLFGEGIIRREPAQPAPERNLTQGETPITPIEILHRPSGPERK